MVLTITGDKEGTGGAKNIHLDEICFMSVSGSGMLVHTMRGSWFTPGTLQYWMEALKPYGVVKADRQNLVNLNRIRFVNCFLRQAYFEERPGNGALMCTLSDKGYRRVKQAIDLSEISHAVAIF